MAIACDNNWPFGACLLRNSPASEMDARQQLPARASQTRPDPGSAFTTHNCCSPTFLYEGDPVLPPLPRDTFPSYLSPYDTLPTMLDDFSIVTTSGIVLWRRSYTPVSTNVVNSLINDVFVEERQKSGAQETAVNPPYKKDKYTVKWTAAKDVGLVFVVGKSACDSIPKS